MPEDAERLAAQLIAALNRADIEAVIALADPDIEWREHFLAPDAQTYHGHDGVRRWWRDVSGPLSEGHFEPGASEVNGDTVITPTRHRGRPEQRRAL